jgi:outer membrane protein assembly factor BamB
MAWRRIDGERAWSTDRLRYRGLTAPLMAGRSIAVGDSTGFVHLLSREDGSLLNRLPTDGSAIVASPVLAGNTLIAVTQNGGVYGFKPEYTRYTRNLIDETCNCISWSPECG